ncbi:MAG: hypothetical protein HYV36_01920 [Lentisphaerae bacterium]|nr:hypothetical protein [Lentisphaerota bacterium]
MPAQVELPVSNPSREELAFSRRLAVLLSCAACPGAGHFVQHRWITGTLFILAFLVCLVMLVISVVGPLMTNLRITLDLAEHGSSESLRAISLFSMLGWFGLALLVYLVALVDVIAYARRQSQRRLAESRKNLEQP